MEVIKRDNHVLPFLWMKGEDNLTIKEELDRIEACGIKEICLESRPHPDFCGPGWWHNMDFIVKEAKERNTRLWILDDDKFPTGHCNGAFTRMPQKKKIYLAERHVDIMGPCKNHAILVENFLSPDGELLGIMAFPKPDGETMDISPIGRIDLTDSLTNGFVYFSLPEGPYRLFVLYTTRKGGGRDDYMNLIDKDSVKVLIDEVYEKHYTRYKEHFGYTIAGFFSDEPELGNVNGYPFDEALGKKDRKLPWSYQLEEMLRNKWGKDFLSLLPGLWYESGKETIRVRSEYMESLTSLVKECFSGQIGNWCTEHGVEYIGHIIEDDNAHARLGCSVGHYFREMKGQHMSGIDVVHHQIVPGFTEPVHQWIAGDRDGEFFHFGLGKLGSSAAHIDSGKRNRALCEIFGNYGWAEGNSLMKWLTNHMLVRGINYFTPHAFSMKYHDRDCPPHFYARGKNPGFECFTTLMKYMDKAAAFLSGGVHQAEAAILYHGEAEWTGKDTMYFHKPGRQLMEAQLDYDVIPADCFIEGEALVRHNKLWINEESYPCLILPYAKYLVKEVAEYIIKEHQNGLKTFVIDGLPTGCTKGEILPTGFQKAVTIVPLKEIQHAVRNCTITNLTVESSDRGLRKYVTKQKNGTAVMWFNENPAKVVETVMIMEEEKKSNEDIIKNEKDLIKERHIEKNTESDLEKELEIDIEKNSVKELTKEVAIYDPWTDRTEIYKLENGRLPLKLYPGEARFLFIRPSTVDAKMLPKLEEIKELNLDWYISKLGENQNKSVKVSANEELPNLNGPNYWPTYTGTYIYESSFIFEKKEDRSYKLLILEAGDSLKVSVNGRDCGCMAGFPNRVTIDEALQQGNNTLCLEIYTTLVWERKDGASTHLQVSATGLTKPPCIEVYEI